MRPEWECKEVVVDVFINKFDTDGLKDHLVGGWEPYAVLPKSMLTWTVLFKRLKKEEA